MTFTIRVDNEGPVDATGIEATDIVPAGLTFQAITAGSGATYDASTKTITWAIGALGNGNHATLAYTAKVDAEGTFVNIAQISKSDQPDGDSTPGNNNPGEDDQSAATVTTSGSSGGGNAGVESEGSMASLLAQRLFERRQDARAQTALMAAPAPFLFASQSASSGKGADDGGLRSIVPTNGPNESIAYEVTPGDLLGVTNATSVFAADYLRTEGRRMGALFGAISPAGVLYDHAKATCDRLGGGRMESIGLIDVDGRPFVMQHLIHPDGSVDYAVSLVAYRSGAEFEVDSRFAYSDYTPSGASGVVNLQVWSVSPAYTVELVQGLLAELSAQGNVSYLNSYDNAPATPSTFVQSGRYEEGNLHLRLAGTPSGTLTVSGFAARTETEAAAGTQSEFTQTITLPAATDANATYTNVTVPVGTIFDARFSVQHGSSASVDQLYYADGAWSYTSGNATVQSFATGIDGRDAEEDAYHVERSASFAGSVVDFASMFRYFRPNGQPVDLTGYQALSFTAKGTGRYSVVVEKAGIQSWDQHQFEIALTGDEREITIPLSDLRRSAGSEGLDPSDVTLLAFYALGNNQSATAFDLTVENVRFTRNTRFTSNGEAAGAGELALNGNAPNPFAGRTDIRFTLPTASDARIEIYDITGRQVAVALDRTMTAGSHSVPFAADGLTAGVYLYRLITPMGAKTGQMTVVR